MQRATPVSNRDHHEASASRMPICTVGTSLNCSRWGAVYVTSLAERKQVTELCALMHSLHKLWPANTHSSPGTEVDIHNVKMMFLSETVGQIKCLHIRNTLKTDLRWKSKVRRHLQVHQSHMQPGCCASQDGPSPLPPQTPHFRFYFPSLFSQSHHHQVRSWKKGLITLSTLYLE